MGELGVAIYVGGNTPEMQSESGVFGIRIAYTLLPALLWLGALLTIRKYSLGETRFDEIKTKISEHKSGS
jgi:Na+/melibiose symporter-like transporter